MIRKSITAVPQATGRQRFPRSQRAMLPNWSVLAAYSFSRSWRSPATSQNWCPRPLVGIEALDCPTSRYVANAGRRRKRRAVHEPHGDVAAGVAPQNVSLTVAVEVAGFRHRPTRRYSREFAEEEIDDPFINHMATVPLVLRHRMSDLPSPLKSPVATIDQLFGTLPIAADVETAVPFMNHMATLPLVSRHRMSVLPSPLKSPVPDTDQMDDMVAILADEEIDDPFINQIATVPLVLRHRMSDFRSPLKSAVPAIVQLVVRCRCRRRRKRRPVHEPHGDATAGVAPQDVGLAVAVEVAVPDDRPACATVAMVVTSVMTVH